MGGAWGTLGGDADRTGKEEEEGRITLPLLFVDCAN